MNETNTLHGGESLVTVITLGRLLQRLEASTTPFDADQYRTVVYRLQDALRAAEPGPMLEAVLDAHPQAAEIYENLRYATSGLVRAPLEKAVAAERMAVEVLARAARPD